MSDDPTTLAPRAAPPGGDWLAALEASVGEDGYVEPLGPNHWAAFTDAGTTLLVTFEPRDRVRPPRGQAVAAARGWSHLALLAEGETFFRDQHVWRYVDRLVDDAFFEDFDRVLFYGADAAGYAACAYAVAAPGATVLAIQPRATMAPAVAVWDRRHLAARRLDFTSRYGFAPAMLEGSGQAFVVYDPAEREDAMHAALFHRPWVTALRARWLGGQLEHVLGKLGALDGLIDAAMDGRLTPRVFAQAIRARRSYGTYLHAMMQRQRSAGHPLREAMVCRSVIARLRAPAFRKRLMELEQARGLP
jgi:hypothetical protein